MDNLTDEQIIAHSKANPKEIFTDDKGRVVFNGVIYDSREHFDMTVNGVFKIVKVWNRVRRFFGLKEL